MTSLRTMVTGRAADAMLAAMVLVVGSLTLVAAAAGPTAQPGAGDEHVPPRGRHAQPPGMGTGGRGA